MTKFGICHGKFSTEFDICFVHILNQIAKFDDIFVKNDSNFLKKMTIVTKNVLLIQSLYFFISILGSMKILTIFLKQFISFLRPKLIPMPLEFVRNKATRNNCGTWQFWLVPMKN